MTTSSKTNNKMTKEKRVNHLRRCDPRCSGLYGGYMDYCNGKCPCHLLGCTSKFSTPAKSPKSMTKENTKLKEEITFYLDNLVLEIGKQVTRDYEDRHGIWEGMSVSNTKTKIAYAKKIEELFDHALTEAREEGYEAGKKHIDTEMRKAMNDWHKHEQTELEK